MTKQYLNDTDLFYELVLSQGKGFLTPKAEHMFILIANNFIHKKWYFNYDDKKDCIQSGLYYMLHNWQNFNSKKYTKALPYMTEIFKRGMTLGFNKLIQRSGSDHYTPSIVSINKFIV